ncbi:hypothetical protein WN944_029085 [Citrus x changshan-huyou]|uniref:Uncharacterized protein n=1 Tax=Citrus x changshan-huyou TaxID=2935761 RepID=A0AAP0QEI9_9ROSI
MAEGIDMGGKMKQNMAREQWSTRMNRGDEMKSQDYSQKSTTKEQHPQKLMNEPRSLDQDSTEPNQCKLNRKTQNGSDITDGEGTELLMNEGEKSRTEKSSNQRPGKTAGCRDQKLEAGKIGEAENEVNKKREGNVNKNCDSVVGQESGPNAMEGEEVDNGLEKIQVKQKRKKWKHQARQLEGKKG